MGDNMCFGCGKNNPIGLRLDFWQEGEDMVTVFTPLPEHQSYDGILHGGLATTVLDEVIGQHLVSLGTPGYTARLTVRFRKPIPVGGKVKFVSHLLKKKGRMFDLEAWAELEDGEKALMANVQMMASERLEGFEKD